MTVHLVGAGPGDPELITVRGLELVRSCDVLVADALVSPDLVDEAPDDALVISRVGMSQEEVSRRVHWQGLPIGENWACSRWRGTAGPRG